MDKTVVDAILSSDVAAVAIANHILLNMLAATLVKEGVLTKAQHLELYQDCINMAQGMVEYPAQPESTRTAAAHAVTLLQAYLTGASAVG